MKHRLVLLRGKPTSGKSTAWHTLQKKKKLNDWVFVDNASIKDMYNNLPDEERKKLSKESLFGILKIVIKTRRNILIEEMSETTLMRYIGKWIKKYKYEIMTFQFEVSRKTAYGRDIQRAKDKWHPFMGKKLVDDLHNYHEGKFDKNGILVNCNKLSKRGVVNFIMDKLDK